MKKVVRRNLLGLSVVLVVFFGAIPGYIDQNKNSVSTVPPHPKPVYYDSIPFIADLHCDELLWDRDLLKEISYGHVDLPRMQRANMAFQVFTVVSKVPFGINIEQNDSNSDQIALLSFVQLRPPSNWFSVKKRALQQCENLADFAEASEGKLRVIKNHGDLERFMADRAKDHSITSGMLGLEGAQPLEGNLDNLKTFYDAGVRYIGLAHFFDNEFAGSEHGMKKGGLTSLGKELIQKMTDLHITIDLAHASSQTIDDVLAVHNGPVLVSHTGVKGVCDNQRNLSDAHLIAIGQHQGLVGIGLWETAVCGTDAAATAKSIRYVADKIGVDKVALGSDWDGAFRMHFDVTGTPRIVAELEKLKFTRPEIEMIMGGNVRDFFLRNLPGE
ncbi:MAG: membrane dipeptidase [Cyclobacteriaceae bacterium]|nr:peptidase M19 [Cytophagales bacterium]HNP77684.1 membrane dipeptidase [Cyclobacteriaceae bacterium]